VRRYDETARRIRARIGESFVLELRARPTAGYAWQVTCTPEVAVLKEERTRPVRSARGAAAVQEFEFAAAREGEGALVVAYGRPWEETVRERIRLIVVVER
jgi:predicted secreted protein